MAQNYGTYDNNYPTKIFNGQRPFAYQDQLDEMNRKMDMMQGEIQQQNDKGVLDMFDVCKRCPENSEICESLVTQVARDHCMDMIKMCDIYCARSSSDNGMHHSEK